MLSKQLNPLEYFRLPWSLTDNGISWLEVTTKCNLACKGCYRDPRKEGHKSMVEIMDDLSVFKAKRKSDCMSIAGGDPLIHPKIVEIVRAVKEQGWKPILNTNGLALTPELLRELKEAGVAGFTFHIDTTQKRKDSLVFEEKEHNALRQKFADMLFEVGGIACSFNMTVSEKNLSQVRHVVEWAQKNPHKAHTLVFILYREPDMGSEFAYFANGLKIKADDFYNDTDFSGKRILKTQDVVDQIRRCDPDYEPCGYLNGSIEPESMKWTMALRFATKNQTLGFAGANFMKTVQHFSHFFRNRWLSYSSPQSLRLGRSAMSLFSLFDRGSRNALKEYLKSLAKNPLLIFKTVFIQTYAIIQPIDILKDGQMNMCDGCPDMTVYKGQLYWSCRLEEIKEHGTFITAVPKSKLAPSEEHAEQHAPAML